MPFFHLRDITRPQRQNFLTVVEGDSSIHTKPQVNPLLHGSSFRFFISVLILGRTSIPKENKSFRKLPNAIPCTGGIFCTAYPEMVAPFFVSTFISWVYLQTSVLHSRSDLPELVLSSSWTFPDPLKPSPETSTPVLLLWTTLS